MSDRIVIIGGGFAGLRLARELNDKGQKIMLVDRVNHHMFQPLFYQVASGRIEPSNISFPFRKIFQRSKNIQFRMTKIKKIIPEENKIIGEEGTFAYDKLVIATGCKSNFFGNSRMEDLSFGMKNTQEAISIRNHILITFERLIIEKEKSPEGNWNIVIVGSGPTGVELAGAFAEMKKYVLPRDYPNMDFSDLRIIINAVEKPLSSMSKEAQNKTEKYLKQLGVECWNNEMVTGYDGSVVSLKSGGSIQSSNVIWAAGVTGNIIEGINPEQIYKNRYVVDRHNKIIGYDNIYAIGDIAYMATPEFPLSHPQVASVAIQQAKNLAKNLLTKDTEKWQNFTYVDRGSMATIGKHKAVVDLPKFKFQGTLAWYFWMFLHLMLILSVRNKIAIFFNWMWSYFNRDSSLRLIITPTRKNSTVQ
ncbi:MAG: NAD(P)/FAD-dependent oxidoreductase [Bergeyella sp.]|nr:NAD(P)/FAD-dependent oxidoreductase [Bergeyella sp.]